MRPSYSLTTDHTFERIEAIVVHEDIFLIVYSVNSIYFFKAPI